MANTKIPSELSSTPSISDSGNATAITINSSEQIGIGTTNPSNLVDIVGTGTDLLQITAPTQPVLRLTRTSGASLDVSTLAAQAIIRTNTDHPIDFLTNSTQRARITNDGKFGVGTSTPTAKFEVSVAGDPEVRLVNTSTSQTLRLDHNSIRTMTNGALAIMVDDSSSKMIRIDTSGAVTMTGQPHIFGSPTNTGGSGIANSWYDYATFSRSNLTVNTVSSQKRFTAPITGVYLISITSIMDESSVRKDIAIDVNGTRIGQNLNDAASGYHYRGWTHAVELQANDYVTINSDDWYNATNTGNDTWRKFSMTLLS